MWRWSCVLMRLVTQRSVPARLEVASQSGSQPAKTLLLFSVCSARLYHSRPRSTLCGCTSTLSIIHRPTAPCKQRRDAHQPLLALNSSHFYTDFMFNPIFNLFAGVKIKKIFKYRQGLTAPLHCFYTVICFPLPLCSRAYFRLWFINKWWFVFQMTYTMRKNYSIVPVHWQMIFLGVIYGPKPRCIQGFKVIFYWSYIGFYTL